MLQQCARDASCCCSSSNLLASPFINSSFWTLLLQNSALVTSLDIKLDAVVVARLESAVGQGWLPWRSGARHSRRHLRHRSWPRCCHRPWAVASSPRHGRLSLRLQSAAPAQTSSPFAVHECHQDLSRRSSPVAWTTVTHCFMASATDYFNDSSRCTSCRRSDHITLVLRQLHWLPVRQRVAVKIAVLVHQSLAGAAPAYLADNCHLLSDAGRRPLRSHSSDIQEAARATNTTNLAIGVSRQPVLDCGTIFHPDCGSRDFPSILSDDLWKHISLATETPSHSFRLIGAI